MCFKKYVALEILLFFAAIALGIWHHFHIIFNPDNYWLLFVTHKFLHGGRYFKDFIEVNPPMIIYLNILPVVLSKFFHCSMATTFIFYVSALAVISILTCQWLLKKSSDIDNKFVRYVFVATVIYVFFFFFSVIFGEREFLATIFILPYLMLVNIRIQKRQINLLAIILIGIFAGIGFAIKPYCFMPLIFVEIYLMFQKKTFWAWCRLETLLISFVLVAYVISIFVFAPEYIYQIVPFAHQFYYLGCAFSWGLLYKNLPYVFMIVTPICFALIRRQLFYKHLADILLLAAFGFLIAYYVARQQWIYHFFPMYVLLCIAIILLIADLFAVTINSKEMSLRKLYQNIGLILLMVAVFLLSPVSNSQFTGKGYFLSRYRANYENISKTFDSVDGDKSMAVFSTMYDLMVLMKYGHLTSIIRYPNPLFLLEGYYVERESLPNERDKKQLDKKEKIIVNIVMHDLIKHRPAFIFFEFGTQGVGQLHSKQGLIYSRIIKPLSSDQQFKKLMRQYRFYKHIEMIRSGAKPEKLIVFKRQM